MSAHILTLDALWSNSPPTVHGPSVIVLPFYFYPKVQDHINVTCEVYVCPTCRTSLIGCTSPMLLSQGCRSRTADVNIVRKFQSLNMG
uniref:Uncharacterized protein n=1 Tax=Rhizophora mucronata TaxID=61149 RepID=A0A2P2IX74_RHIMU